MITLYENLRTIVYAPFYLADLRGYWADQGLDVNIRLSPDPVETAEGLLAGRADISWGGPMRVMLHHDRDPVLLYPELTELGWSAERLPGEPGELRLRLTPGG